MPHCLPGNFSLAGFHSIYPRGKSCDSRVATLFSENKIQPPQSSYPTSLAVLPLAEPPFRKSIKILTRVPLRRIMFISSPVSQCESSGIIISINDRFCKFLSQQGKRKRPCGLFSNPAEINPGHEPSGKGVSTASWTNQRSVAVTLPRLIV